MPKMSVPAKRSVSVLNTCSFGALMKKRSRGKEYVDKYLQLELILASLLDLDPEATVSACVLWGLLFPYTLMGVICFSYVCSI